MLRAPNRNKFQCWMIGEATSSAKSSLSQQFCLSIGEVTASNKRARSQEFVRTMGESIRLEYAVHLFIKVIVTKLSMFIHHSTQLTNRVESREVDLVFETFLFKMLTLHKVTFHRNFHTVSVRIRQNRNEIYLLRKLELDNIGDLKEKTAFKGFHVTLRKTEVGVGRDCPTSYVHFEKTSWL